MDDWEAWAAPQRYAGGEEQLWGEIRLALAGDPTDDELCDLAVNTIEALVDLFWPAALDALHDLACRDARLRKALSCCWFDDHVPEDVRVQLEQLVRPQDDIGRLPG